MTGELRSRLRRDTADEHAALEHLLDLPGSLDGPARTAAVLGRFAGFFATLEPALDRALGAAVMTGRHRGPDLAHDLAGLGVGRSARARLPHAPSSGDPLTPAAALGALYVVEGARLGGQLIGRALAERDWLPAGGFRFWPMHGEPERWRTLLVMLDDAPDGDEVVDGAATTFVRLRTWMADAPPTLAPPAIAR